MLETLEKASRKCRRAFRRAIEKCSGDSCGNSREATSLSKEDKPIYGIWLQLTCLGLSLA